MYWYSESKYMFQNCPLPFKSKFKKQPNRSYQGYQEQDSGVEMVIWNDNGAVTIQPISNARRWSKQARDYINVPRPAMIGCYNSSMGGMDQMDQSVASCCLFIRNRKWYWLLLLFSVWSKSIIHGSYIEVWKKTSFLDHIQSITMLYLQTYRHAKEIIPSAETFFHNSHVSKWVEESLDLMGWIILFVLLRSQYVHSVGKQRNINVSIVTLSCTIIVFQLFMDSKSDVL